MQLTRIGFIGFRMFPSHPPLLRLYLVLAIGGLLIFCTCSTHVISMLRYQDAL